MKQILTTLFICLYITFAGCSHDDADELMGGGDRGNESPLNEYIIEFKVETTEELNQLYMNISLEKNAEVTVDWGDGLSNHYKYVNYRKFSIDHLYALQHNVYKVRISTVGLSFFDIYKYKINSIRDLRFGICPDLWEINLNNIDNKKLTFQKVSRLIVENCPNVTKIDFLTQEEIVGEIHISNNPVLKEVDINNITYGGIGCFGNSMLEKIKLGKLVRSVGDVEVAISVNNNNLDANALNEIFRKLPNKEDTDFITPYISFRGNPGTETCDRSIYENKGWVIHKW